MPARKRKSSLRWVSEGLQVEVSDRYGHWYPCEVTEVWFDEGLLAYSILFHNLRLLKRMKKPTYTEPAIGWNEEEMKSGIAKYGVAKY